MQSDDGNVRQVINTRFARPCHNVAGRVCVARSPHESPNAPRRRGCWCLFYCRVSVNQMRHALIMRASEITFPQAAPELLIETRGVLWHLAFLLHPKMLLAAGHCTEAARERFCPRLKIEAGLDRLAQTARAARGARPVARCVTALRFSGALIARSKMHSWL